MGRRRFSPKQIIIKLRKAEVIESKGLAHYLLSRAAPGRMATTNHLMGNSGMSY